VNDPHLNPLPHEGRKRKYPNIEKLIVGTKLLPTIENNYGKV